jgi:Protein of unknown function (DUF2505)
VRFHTEHHFHATPDQVAEALCDAAFYRVLDLPDLSEPEVIEQKTSGDTTDLRLRYEFVGGLDPIARRLLGSQRLSWVQEIRVDRSTHSGTLGFEAEKAPRKLHGDARFVLEEEGSETGKSRSNERGTEDRGAQTLRRLDGELVVAVIGIGAMAERKIVPGLLRRLDIEASALDDRLRSGT